MKKIFFAMMLTVAALGLTSCGDDEHMDSHLTYYPEITVNGDDVVQVELGNAYVEQGATAILNGEDVSDGVVISSDVDDSKAGIYTVNYEYTNADGFSSSTSRTVVVCNPNITTDISGTYTVATNSYRDYNGTLVSFGGYEVTVTQAYPGIFYVSDLLGGYYDQRLGYGSDYAMTGYIALDADNSVSLLTSNVAGWGDSATGWADGSYDAATGKISYVVNYASVMDFYITLTKQTGE